MHLTYQLSSGALFCAGLACLLLGIRRPGTRGLVLPSGIALWLLAVVISTRVAVGVMVTLRELLRNTPALRDNALLVQAGLVGLVAVSGLLITVLIVTRGRRQGTLLLAPLCTVLAVLLWFVGVSSLDIFEAPLKLTFASIRLLGWIWIALSAVTVIVCVATAMRPRDY